MAWCELTIHSACFGPYAFRVFLGVTSWSSSRYLSTTVETLALTRWTRPGSSRSIFSSSWGISRDDSDVDGKVGGKRMT